MTHFVCACGGERFDVEPEPAGTNWCRFVATCHGCGASALVTGTNEDGRLALRITGRLRLVTDDHDRDRRARTAATCPASYEFRGDGCTFAPVTVATAEADLRRFRAERSGVMNHPGLSGHLAGWRRLEDVDARDLTIPTNMCKISSSEAE